MVNAISYKFNRIVSDIITEVKIKNRLTVDMLTTKGLWDTGAQNSAITKKAAKALRLVPVSKVNVRGVHGVKQVNVYFIQIFLNNPNIMVPCLVTECEELSNDGSIDLLLGMNVISQGDFVVSNYNNQTVMTFRVPSLCAIDYVAEINEYNKCLRHYKINVSKGINNVKCFCGSGRSFLNCHAKSIYHGK